MTRFYSARCKACGWFPEKFDDVEKCREVAAEHAEECSGKDPIDIRAWGNA